MLPYTHEDVDYLLNLKFDEVLPSGRWKYGEFETVERKIMEKTLIDLGHVDNLCLLTINECKN